MFWFHRLSFSWCQCSVCVVVVVFYVIVCSCRIYFYYHFHFYTGISFHSFSFRHWRTFFGCEWVAKMPFSSRKIQVSWILLHARAYYSTNENMYVAPQTNEKCLTKEKEYDQEEIHHRKKMARKWSFIDGPIV